MKRWRYCWYLSLIAISLTLASFASGGENSVRTNHSFCYIFGGLGEAYGPSDFRLGIGKTELGLIQGRLLGVAWPINLSSSYYLALGTGLYLPDGHWRNLSLYAGLGKDFWYWRYLNFRWELGMYTNISNYTGGRFSLGLNLGW